MTIAVRPGSPGDRRFIIDAALSSYRSSYSAGLIPIAAFNGVMWPVFESLLDRPDMRVMVAYETEATPGVADLYGFIAFEAGPVPLVLYIYTREAARRSGIARSLFAAAGVDPLRPFHYAARTSVVGRIEDARKIPCAKWKPLLARYPNRRDA